MITKQRLINDQGLTLIELTITIAVLGVIIVPLVASFTLALLETTSSRERTADATSAQVISTYLQNDIQSSCLHTTAADPSTACGTGSVVKNTGVCADDPTTVKLELTWRDVVAASGTANYILVDYYVAKTADNQLELHRAECIRNATTGIVGDPKDTLLALNLEPVSGTSIFDATCAPLADCTGAPKTVTVKIIAKSTRVEQTSSYEPFEFTFAATRRSGS